MTRMKMRLARRKCLRRRKRKRKRLKLRKRRLRGADGGGNLRGDGGEADLEEGRDGMFIAIFPERTVSPRLLVLRKEKTKKTKKLKTKKK
jgi:hypothetical protein